MTLRSITVLNEKGGCGKTTISTHVATGLAIRGRKVILIDTDPQGHATVAVGLPKRPAFHDLAARGASWKDSVALVHPDVYSPKSKQAAGLLYCVAGNHESYTTAAHLPRQSIIRERFAEIQERFDYIIVDTAPTPSVLHEAIAAASDYILIPTECEMFSSYEGLPESMKHVGRVHQAGARRGIDVAQIAGIIPNKFDKKSVLHNDVLTDLQSRYDGLMWEPLPASKTIAQAQMRGQFLYSMYPNNAITRKFWDVIDHLEAVCQTS